VAIKTCERESIEKTNKSLVAPADMAFASAPVEGSPKTERIPDPKTRPGNTFKVGRGPVALLFDGANIWVANLGDGTVTKL